MNGMPSRQGYPARRAPAAWDESCDALPRIADRPGVSFYNGRTSATALEAGAPSRLANSKLGLSNRRENDKTGRPVTP
jgi:hypothetical protein